MLTNDRGLMENREEPIEVEPGMFIPKREVRYYNELKSLSREEKLFLWEMMRGASKKEHIYIYNGEKSILKKFIKLKLISINKLYKPRNDELSLFILPYAPTLLKELRKKNKGK